MKKLNYETKTIVAISLIAFILCIVVSYFSWHISQLNKYISTMQSDLVSTHEELIKTQEDLFAETKKSAELSKVLEETNTIISDLKSDEYEFIYLGDFKLTHYCTELIDHICGTGDGITSSGTQITTGRSVAVDPAIIPYGSQLYIEGYGFYIAEDCGGAVQGEHINIAVETHEQAINMGITNGGVWILVKKS